ncbi:MAG: hypothetical protein JO102_07370, partial [Elusimicrobia bacterium]|nr:hypothetical protein [Elusimicrobiota bacterium]
YRRYAAARPELQPDVEKAAAGVLAPLKPELAAAFRDAIGAFAARLTRPSLTWLGETVGFLPVLAAGLATGNPILIGLGLLIQIFGLPAAHVLVDRRAASPARRFAARLQWSSALAGLYGVSFGLVAVAGAPVVAAAVLAFVPVAALHFANHRAFARPASSIAFVLNRVLRLPQLQMTTLPTVPADQAALVGAVEVEVAAALRAWRALPDRMTATVVEDPVTVVMRRLATEQVDRDPDQRAAVGVGVVRAIVTANLTPQELQARVRRDAVDALTYAIDTPPDSDLRDQIGLFSMGVYGGVAVAMESMPHANAIEQGGMAAIAETSRRLTADAIQRWRDTRGDNLESGDERLQQVWTFLRLSATRGNIPVTEYLKGIMAAINDARFTVQEVRVRANRDAHSEFAAGASSLLHLAWGQYAAEQTSRARRGTVSEHAAAVVAGFTDAVRAATSERFGTALTAWRESNPNPEARNRDSILTAYRDNFIPVTDIAKAESLSMIAGAADAYLALDVPPTELAAVVRGDIQVMVDYWYTTGMSNPIMLDIVLAIHREVAQRAGGERAAAVEAAINEGWLGAVRRISYHVVRDTRNPPAAAGQRQVPNMNQFANRVLDYATRQRLDSEELSDAVADGFADAEMLAGEVDRWINGTLPAAMDAPLSRDNIHRLQFLHAIAHRLPGVLRGPATHAAGDALARYVNVLPELRARLRTWKNGGSTAQNADDTAIRGIMARLASLSRLSDDDETFRHLRDALRDAGLSPTQLEARAERDFGAVCQTYPARPILPEMQVWSLKMADPNLQVVLDVYIPLARAYHEAGDPDRAGAILKGLVTTAGRTLTGGIDGQHSRSFTIVLQALGYACIKFDQPELGVAAGKMLAQLATPGFEMPDVIRWTYDILGESYREQHIAALALENGFEYITMMAWRDLNAGMHRSSEIISFYSRLGETARLLFQTGTPSGALSYTAFGLKFLGDHPEYREFIPEPLQRKVAGMHAAAQAVVERDPARAAALVREAEEEFAPLIADGADETEAHYLKSVLFEINAEACRSGDPAFLARVRELGADVHSAPEQRRLLAGTVSRAIRGLALADPGRRAALEAENAALFSSDDPLAQPVHSIVDVVYVTSYAMGEAVFGRVDRGIEILRRVLAQTDAANAEDIAPDVATRIRGVTLLQLVTLLSRKGAPISEMSPLIHEALAIEVRDERTIDTMSRFVEPGLANEEAVLKAVDAVVTAPDRHGPS